MKYDGDLTLSQIRHGFSNYSKHHQSYWKSQGRRIVKRVEKTEDIVAKIYYLLQKQVPGFLKQYNNNNNNFYGASSGRAPNKRCNFYVKGSQNTTEAL